MATELKSNMSRTFSNSGFSRAYSSVAKPFHFTKLQQANTTPLPSPATQKASRKKGRTSCMGAYCCFFTGCISVIITAAIGLGIAALVIWLVLRPIHTPTYDVRGVNVSKFEYSPSSHALDAAASYTVVAFNGNAKIGVKYDSISIGTSYLGQVFDHATIPGFYQGHRQNKTLPMSFTTTGFPLTATNGALLETNIQAQSVPLLMRVDVTARLKIGAITTPRFKVHVNCNVVIKPPAGTAPAQVLQQSCRRV